MQTKTIPDRVFEVKDPGGRSYRVTRYAWLDNVAEQGSPAQWRESWHLWMTDNGGLLDALGDGRYRVEGTGTIVETVEQASATA